MAFDVAPEPVRRSGRRLPAIVVVGLGTGLVAIAVATASPPAEGDGVAPTTATGPPAAIAPESPRRGSTSPGPAGTRPAAGARLPGAIECHDLEAGPCLAVARATVAVLPRDDAVARIDAWSSILCRDTLDCPPRRLVGAEPIGSAVVAFADGGPSAWVNVVDPGQPPSGSGPTVAPVAWIVSWRP